MAMVKCPECEEERSDQAGSACPKCGHKFPNTAAIFLKRYRWNIAVSGLFLLGMLIDKNGAFAKYSIIAYKNTGIKYFFTIFCLAGIAGFWVASFMFWRDLPKASAINAKKEIEPFRGNPDHTFIDKVFCFWQVCFEWGQFYFETYVNAFLGLLMSFWLGLPLFAGGIDWTFGFGLWRLIDHSYVLVITLVISAYVVITKKPV